MMREYQPFAYPPDYKIAEIHHEATRPGKVNMSKSLKCPCCNQSAKEPLNSWFKRDINHDFKNYGGAVVTYFWIIKLYAFISFLVLILYSLFLLYTIDQACRQRGYESVEECEIFLGMFIITNEHLFTIMQRKNWQQQMSRILTLRAIVFVILIFGNFMALYVSGRFQRRFPQSKSIKDFSLMFKNCPISPNQLIGKLSKKVPDLKIREIFTVKQMEPFHELYNLKLNSYFKCLIEQSPKQKLKLLKELQSLNVKCKRHEKNYGIDSDRIIIVFESEQDRNFLHKIYELTQGRKIKLLTGFKIKQEQIYCQKCPIPQEIIWNNLGSYEKKKTQAKVLSIIYFFLLITGSYLLLFFCMRIVYDPETLPSPLNGILANIIMTLLVPLALTFRSLMNKLSQMRRPNTQTSKTLFIVITTVLFHIIYYVIIPTFYLCMSEDADGNKILAIITNSTFNFLIIQFTLASVDMTYCSWSKRLKKVKDEGKPIGCQKMIHSLIQYPRFPIEFKLIILFKTFSFIILFAFESPFIMLLCFVLLVFLYFKDKYGLYHHYRMEIIDNDVQFNFLKIYSCFFSVYTFLIYYLTQLKSQRFEQTKIQLYVTIVLVVISLILQIFYIKNQTFQDQTILPSTFQQEQIKDSYLERYEKFRQSVVSKETDSKIDDYLNNHLISTKTEETLETKLI